MNDPSSVSRDYDDVITEHYRSVAEDSGLDATSTMADTTTRSTESEAIIDFVRLAIAEMPDRKPKIAHLGCGNGYTLGLLAEQAPNASYLGLEKSPDLRALAQSRFVGAGGENVAILEGDIRNASTLPDDADVIFCQRVLINLLDPEDQTLALDNIVNTARPGARLLFIEAFDSSLARLNTARAEFDLPAIPPAHHNLYLGDDFFDRPGLAPFSSPEWDWPDNFLSTHYFVSRVLHPVALADRPFIRNSEFVRFFSSALPPAVGDYSQLKLRCFTRV